MSTSRSAPMFVLDAGALVAVERAEPAMTALLMRVRGFQARVIVPDAVLAQVWRTGAGRQARVSALLGLKSEQCLKLPLDTEAAKRIGAAIKRSGHADVVDVHVAIAASDHAAAVITSDREDILAVNPALKSVIVEV